MMEKSYRDRPRNSFILIFAFFLNLLALKYNPSLILNLNYKIGLILFPVFILVYLFYYIYGRIEIHTTKLVSRTGNIKFYYHEIPWNEVTWLEDDYFWPLYATHVYGFSNPEIRKKFIDEYRSLELKEYRPVKDKEDLKDYIKRAKNLGLIRKRGSRSIMFVNLFVKGYKDFNREVIFRSPPDTVVPYSLLKRVGLTQSDIGRLYKNNLGN